MDFMDLLSESGINDPELFKYLKSKKFKISQDITTKRVRLGLSQSDLAEKLDITEKRVIEIESASNRVSEKDCRELLNSLKSLEHEEKDTIFDKKKDMNMLSVCCTTTDYLKEMDNSFFREIKFKKSKSFMEVVKLHTDVTYESTDSNEFSILDSLNNTFFPRISKISSENPIEGVNQDTFFNGAENVQTRELQV